MTDGQHRPKPHTTPARAPEVLRTSDIWRLQDSLDPHSQAAYRLRVMRGLPGPWPVAAVARAVGLCRVLKIIADRPPWREVLAQARAHPCRQCGSRGPHQPRCTPWVIHWGEVRCGACTAHVRWLPKPPDTDRGAWKLYADEFVKYADELSKAWARYNLEEYLDSLGLIWRHEPHALLLVGAAGRPSFTHHDLPPDQRARIRTLIAEVREAHGWGEKVWLWPDALPSPQADLFATPAEPQP